MKVAVDRWIGASARVIALRTSASDCAASLGARPAQTSNHIATRRITAEHTICGTIETGSSLPLPKTRPHRWAPPARLSGLSSIEPPYVHRVPHKANQREHPSGQPGDDQSRCEPPVNKPA